MRSGYAAFIGKPNVGKSTLMNELIGQKIAITSPKPQTTRSRIETVYTDERGQIVLLDTPGIHKAKNKLGEYMDDVAERTFSEADVIVWVVEPRDELGEEEERIARLINEKNSGRKPLILAVNKADRFKNEKELSDTAALYKARVEPREVIAVSALKGDNVDRLRDMLFELMPEGPLYYDEDTVTMIPMRSIAEELIREQALRQLSDEVPHGIAVMVQSFKERRPGLYDIEADIVCERDSHKGMIIGKGGRMLKSIGSAARKEIEAQLEAQVNLKLFVKVRKDWRDNEGFIRNFGYDLRKL